MLTNNRKSKRRRYIRYPIALEAVLFIEKSITVQCLILDFCSGGFFLGLKQPNTEIPLYKNIKICFAIGLETKCENFEINARTVHITSTGAGVAVDNMPVSAFNALTHVANAGSLAVINDRRSSTPNKINQENCKIAFKQLLVEKLPPLLGRFFESLRKDLEDAGQKVDYLANSSQLDDLITTLELNRESFVSEFCSSVISLVDGISEPYRKIEDISATNDELSLVDKAEFEDWLKISVIVRKLDIHFEESFNKLTREFVRVFGPFSTAINNPISPAVLCGSFREMILQFELCNKTNSILYHSFEKTLINGLIPLYEQSIQLLLKFGPADTLAPYFAEQTNKASERFQPRHLSAVEKSISNRDGLQKFLIENHLPLQAHNPTTQKNLQPITQITGKLLDILTEINDVSPEAVKRIMSGDKSDSSNQGYSYYSDDDVVNALSKLQLTLGDNSTLHLDSTALNQRLQETLDNLSLGTKSLSKDNSQRLEIYGKFFETLFNDFDFSADIKTYLEKIHLPLLSLPLQGNDFLDDDVHPARAILNQLAALESAVKGDKAIGQIKVKNTLNRLVDRIAREASTNPAIFKEVEQELDGISKGVSLSTELKIRRLVNTHEEQQKFENTKRSVQLEIDQHIGGRPIPAIIPLLLKSGWQQLLLDAELNKEKNSAEKLKYLAVLDDLIFWHYEPDSIRKIQAGSIKKTLEFIEDALKPVCPDASQRSNIIAELSALLLGIGIPKIGKRVETAGIEPENPAVPTLADNWTLLVEQLGVGEWLMISSGSAGFEPMKLVWIGDVVQVYVFVNRDGLNPLEVGKNELANLLRSGGAHKMESLDTPLMDRATNSMLQKMHKKLIHNATHDPVTDLFTGTSLSGNSKMKWPSSIIPIICSAIWKYWIYA